MISFKDLEKESDGKTESEIFERFGNEGVLAFREIVSEIYQKDGTGMALCLFHRAFSARIFDGAEYYFTYPVGEDAQELAREICLYAVKEEIPLVFSRVPRERIGGLVCSFCHIDLDAEDICRSYYRARIKSEADLLEAPPTLETEEISFSPLKEEDIPEYARLIRDEGANKYWGYDYREDINNPEDRYFYDTATAEFARGVSVTFALRREGRFVGEAAFYAFDRAGGAEIAFRLLPEWRGKGLGRAAVEGLLAMAEEIGLVKIKATADKRNLPSVKLLSDYMDIVCEDEERIYFSLSGEE